MTPMAIRFMNEQSGEHQKACLPWLPHLSAMCAFRRQAIFLYQFMLTAADGYMPMSLMSKHKYLNLELCMEELDPTWRISAERT